MSAMFKKAQKHSSLIIVCYVISQPQPFSYGCKDNCYPFSNSIKIYLGRKVGLPMKRMNYRKFIGDIEQNLLEVA